MVIKDWGENAFLILMNAIYGCICSVPKELYLQGLTEVTVRID